MKGTERSQGALQPESQKVPGGNHSASTTPEVRPVLSVLWEGQQAPEGTTCCHSPHPHEDCWEP